jgi:hypothetical protein
MSRIHWVARGTGTPKDRDEVNRREVFECDGRVCYLDVMGAPSKLIVIRKEVSLSRDSKPDQPSFWSWSSSEKLFIMNRENGELKRRLVERVKEMRSKKLLLFIMNR